MIIIKTGRYNQRHPTESVPEPKTAARTPKGDSRLPTKHPRILCSSPSYHHHSPLSCLLSFLPYFIHSWPLSVPPSTQFDPYRWTFNNIRWMIACEHCMSMAFFGEVGYSVALKKGSLLLHFPIHCPYWPGSFGPMLIPVYVNTHSP